MAECRPREVIRRSRGHRASRFSPRGGTGYLIGKVRHVQHVMARWAGTQICYRSNLSEMQLVLREIQMSFPPGAPGHPCPSGPGCSVPPGTSSKPPLGPRIRWERPPNVEQFRLGCFQIQSGPTWDMVPPHHIPLSSIRHCGSVATRDKPGLPRRPYPAPLHCSLHLHSIPVEKPQIQRRSPALPRHPPGSPVPTALFVALFPFTLWGLVGFPPAIRGAE